MIPALIGAVLAVATVWLMWWIRDYRAVTRELMSFPGTVIANTMAPTLAEISADPRIPAHYREHAAKLGKRIVAGDSPPTDTGVLWYDGPLLEDVEPAEPYDGPVKALMSPYEVMVPAPRYASGGPVKGGVVWFNEYMEMPSPRAKETRRDPITGEILADNPPAQSGAQYYAGRADLDRLIVDPTASIHDVIAEVEHLCNREFHASKYYRENPDLQYAGHPWMKFVAAGHAAYLGWEPGEGRP